MGVARACEDVLSGAVVRHYLGPVLLILWSAPHAILGVYANAHAGGSMSRLFEDLKSGTVWSTMKMELNERGFAAGKMLLAYALFEIMLMLVLPGRPYNGPKTVTGHVPKYKDNGLLAYAISLTMVFIMHQQGWFPIWTLYDNFLAAIAIMIVFALWFCLWLYAKGRLYPSSTDNQFHGIFAIDYYSGIELYPRIGPLDIKMFTNCRFGMMCWPILCIAYAAKQQQLYGSISNSMWISVLLQVIYCGKFFVWEEGYMGSVDIMHDRAGYYICWGCLCLVPSLYTAHTMFLVNYPYDYPKPIAVMLFLAGIAFILINFWADEQRQRARRTNGKCTIWGKPAEIIHSKYTEVRDGKTEEKHSLLLASGFWGISRHFHYVPEILAAVCWSAPIPHGYVFPYFYIIFLTALLVDRSTRDDRKCSAKYGIYWDEYCKRVPYRIVPYVF